MLLFLLPVGETAKKMVYVVKNEGQSRLGA